MIQQLGRTACFLAGILATASAASAQQDAPAGHWKKHVVYSGAACATAVAADFTGDALPDVICGAAGATRLLVAPDWTEVVLEADRNMRLIHSEVMDVDRDGDPDFVGAVYKPGLIFWLERPDRPTAQRWPFRLVDDQLDGVHGLLAGDVDGDGQNDLLANSGQPAGPLANSLVWLGVPAHSHSAKHWTRHIVADGNAPGLSHYLGLGDVDGDGRPDVCSAAKGGPSDATKQGNWFAWWRAPDSSRGTWKKTTIAQQHMGATNIHPCDVNGDGQTDFVASRGHGRGVVWFEGPGWAVHDIHPTLHGPHCLVVADLDGDGDVDAATCAKDDRTAAWFENDGRGRFKTHIVGRDQAAYDIRAVDMDRDRDLDLLVAGQSSRNVVWFENPNK